MKKILLTLIIAYRKFFSLLFSQTFYLTDHSCRFIPTCSQYTYQAINRYGIIKGAYLGFMRLIRCHPLAKGGVDFLE